MKAESYRDPVTRNVGVSLTMDALEYADSPRLIVQRAIELAAQALANQIVKDYGQEIIAKCDMQAVANLTIAEAASAIRDTIHRKLPDVVHTRVEKQVYQRGILGGTRRIV